jgi:hypothetical protein
MNTKHTFSIATVAAVLALTSPAYAGHLGGAGMLGGNFGGNSSSVGGRGGFGGNLHGSPDSVGSKSIAKAPKKVDGQAKTDASGTKTAAQDAKPGASTSASTNAATSAAATAKPATSASLAGGADQTVGVGSRTVTAGTAASTSSN